VGIVITTIAILRHPGLPRWTIVLPLLAAAALVLGFALPPANQVAAAAFYLGFAIWGWSLLAGRSGGARRDHERGDVSCPSGGLSWCAASS
jgi:H+/gluconate symporter-like permease